jgi:hypothetical protein
LKLCYSFIDFVTLTFVAYFLLLPLQDVVLYFCFNFCILQLSAGV